MPKTVQEARSVAKQLGGYIANASQVRNSEGQWHAEVAVRVPSDRYGDALSQLQALGETDSFREQVQDVTEEFVDLEARVRNLKRSEQQLLLLLNRTGRVGDLLDVERELTRRRSEIESLEGRLRYLTYQTSFSTVYVSIVEFRPRPVPASAFSLPKTFADAFRTVVLILRTALAAAIWVLVFGILWVPLAALGGWLVWKRRLKQATQVGGSE